MVALDIETTGLDPYKDKIVAVCINGEVLSTYAKDPIKERLEAIKDELIVGHNLAFDAKFIYVHYGIELNNLWCTYIAARILNNGKDFEHSLVNGLSYYLGVREGSHSSKDEIRKNFSLKRPLTPTELDYIRADVNHLIPLKERLEKEIKDNLLEKVMKLEMSVMPAIIRMEAGGVRINTEYLKYLISIWKRGHRIAMMKLDREIMRLQPYSKKPTIFPTYNYSSPKQMAKLFGDFGYKPPMKKNSEGKWLPTVEADSIRSWLNEHQDAKIRRFLEILIWYKEVDKLLGTYGEPVLEKVINGVLHTEYKQIGADTGRLSSSAPNLQNIPSSGHGAKMRHCFLPDEGEVFLEADMEGAELRLAADYSKDEALIKSFTEGLDLHSKLASKSYSVMLGQPITINKSSHPIKIGHQQLVPVKARDGHKPVVFSYLYLGGPARIYGTLGEDLWRFCDPSTHMDICREIHRGLGEELPILNRWLKSRVNEAQQRGYLRGPKLGRIRYFSKDVYGDAANNDLQMANSEAIKVAIINMDREIRGKGRLLLTVHDSLAVSCKPEYVPEIKEKLKKVMADALSYFLNNIPGAATVKESQYWSK